MLLAVARTPPLTVKGIATPLRPMIMPKRYIFKFFIFSDIFVKKKVVIG